MASSFDKPQHKRDLLSVRKLIREGRPAEAFRKADSHVTDSPGCAEWWRERGIAQFFTKDFDGAIESFTTIIDMDPSDGDAWKRMAITKAEAGRDREAIDDFNVAAELAPRDPDTWTEMGKSLTRIQKHEKAARAFKRATEEDESYAAAWHLLALSLERMGKEGEALKSFHRAVSVDPGNARIWTDRGCFFYRAGQARLESSDPSACALGVTFLREALRSWDNALIADPSFESANFNRTTLLSGVGDEDAFRSIPVLQGQPEAPDTE